MITVVLLELRPQDKCHAYGGSAQQTTWPQYKVTTRLSAAIILFININSVLKGCSLKYRAFIPVKFQTRPRKNKFRQMGYCTIAKI